MEPHPHLRILFIGEGEIEVLDVVVLDEPNFGGEEIGRVVSEVAEVDAEADDLEDNSCIFLQVVIS